MSQQEQASQNYSLSIWYLLNYKTGGKSLGCLKSRAESTEFFDYLIQQAGNFSWVLHNWGEVGRLVMWMEAMYLNQVSPAWAWCNAFDERFFMSSLPDLCL